MAEIESKPEILAGKPVVAGTRISVELILEKLGAGETIEDLLEAHPRLTRAAVLSALRYAPAENLDLHLHESARLSAGRSPVTTSATVVELEAKIQSLSRSDRADLLRKLLIDLDGPPDQGVEAAWIDEAKKRQAQLESGEVQGIPGEEVFERLRVRFKR